MNPDPNGNIVVYVLWALVTLVVTMGGALAYVLKKKPSKNHRTFADDPDQYWERMRQVVTEPLAKVLDKQTNMMQELVKEIIRIDERSRFKLGLKD